MVIWQARMFLRACVCLEGHVNTLSENVSFVLQETTRCESVCRDRPRRHVVLGWPLTNSYKIMWLLDALQ